MFESHIYRKEEKSTMCQSWLLMDENEIIMSFCCKDERCRMKLGGIGLYSSLMIDGRLLFCAWLKELVMKQSFNTSKLSTMAFDSWVTRTLGTISRPAVPL